MRPFFSTLFFCLCKAISALPILIEESALVLSILFGIFGLSFFDSQFLKVMLKLIDEVLSRSAFKWKFDSF